MCGGWFGCLVEGTSDILTTFISPPPSHSQLYPPGAASINITNIQHSFILSLNYLGEDDMTS